MNSLKLLAARIPLIAALIFVSVNSAFPPPVLAQENPGKISFQPNTIPQVTMVYEEYTFRFQYKSFFIRVAPFVIYHGEYYSLKQIIPWIKNNYPQASYSWLLKKLKTSIHYGFNLTQLPQKVADGVDYVGFKLVDLNFPLSWFELEQQEKMNEEDQAYNLTLIHIPKAHLTFSFEDLYLYGYTVTHVNSTYILIGGVKGKTKWNLDPIIFSDPIITVTGFTEGDPSNYWEIANATDKNGWVRNDRTLLDNAFSMDTPHSLTKPIILPPNQTGVLLKITVISWYLTGTMTLNGANASGQSDSEDIDITGNGDFETTVEWASIDENGIITADGYYTFDVIQYGIVPFMQVSDSQYWQNCQIVVGDGSTETWFTETDTQIVIAPYICASSVFLMVKDEAHVRFGELLDADLKLSGKGVSMISTDPIQTSTVIAASYTSWNGSLEIYGCYFRSLYAKGLISCAVDSQIYNTVLDNVQLQSYSACAIDVYDLTIKNVDGWGFGAISGTMNEIMLWNNTYAFYGYYDDSATWSNVIARNNTYTMRCSTTIVNHYLVNVDSDQWSFSWGGSNYGEVYRQYSFNLFLSYENGSIVEDASVTISHYGQGGGEDYSGSTGANGSIPPQILSMGFYDQAGGNSLYDFNPYHLSIVKGDHTYGGNFTHSKKENMIIILQEPEETPSIGPFYHSYIIDYGAALMIRAPDRVEPSLTQYLANTVPISIEIQLLNRMSRTRNLGLLYNVTGPEGELVLEGSLQEDLDPNSQEELTLSWEVPLRKKEVPKNYTLTLEVQSRGRILGNPISYTITVAQSSWAPLYVLSLLGIVGVVAGVCYGGYRLFRKGESREA